jgi:hypothetical protein
MERWGGGNGWHRRTNARPLMVFMAALTGRFNPQIKGEITSGGGGVMEHVARKRGKAGHGGGGGGALLWSEVGDDIVDRLGRAGCEARWAGVVGWWAGRLGSVGGPRAKEWAG